MGLKKRCSFVKFQKVKMVKDNWVLVVGDHELPLGQFFMPILTVVLLLDLCFQFGVYTQEIIKFTSFMAVDGAYEPGSDLYMKCRPELDRNYVGWNCNLQNGTKIYGDTNLVHTKNDISVGFHNTSGTG